MEKLAGLRFDNPNNACMSLRCLAEWVRSGDVVVKLLPSDTADSAPNLCFSAREPGATRP